MQSGEAKQFHFCYVCNTQLNSCKQALLHCSGKRHRKKLQFLQTRKTNVGQHEQMLPASTTPLVQSPLVQSRPLIPMTADQTPGGFTFPLVNAYHSVAPMMTSFHTESPLYMAARANASFFQAPQAQMFNVHQQQPNYWMSQAEANPPTFFQLRPTAVPFRRKFVSAYSGSSASSPMGATDASMQGDSSCHSATGRISRSETSSVSSESDAVKVYTCTDCSLQYDSRAGLYAHLQQSRHCKASMQKKSKRQSTGQSTEPPSGDASETDSFVSSTSIYYCAACNIAVNSQCQLDMHNGGQKHKQRVQAQRKQTRSSSSSSDTTEKVMDSGYVSSSGDEVICVSPPTADKPTAKFRCQLCNLLLNSPAQAKQHLRSQKHLIRVNANKTFNRSSLRRKSAPKPLSSTVEGKEAETDDSFDFGHMIRAISDPDPDAEEEASTICGA